MAGLANCVMTISLVRKKCCMQAVTNLDEMLLLAENGEWRENVKDKHKKDAKNGWYRYSTQFALPVLDIKSCRPLHGIQRNAPHSQ